MTGRQAPSSPPNLWPTWPKWPTWLCCLSFRLPRAQRPEVQGLVPLGSSLVDLVNLKEKERNKRDREVERGRKGEQTSDPCRSAKSTRGPGTHVGLRSSLGNLENGSRPLRPGRPLWRDIGVERLELHATSPAPPGQVQQQQPDQTSPSGLVSSAARALRAHLPGIGRS